MGAIARGRARSEREEQARLEAARSEERTHSEIQVWLRDLGHALGFDVWIAANDRGRPDGSGGRLDDRSARG